MINLIDLKGLSIYEQLQIEEALLRTESKNYCLINTNSSAAVVMGISGQKEKLMDLQALETHRIPLIRRFSGGGTVYVDQDTIFVTFVCNQEAFPVPPFPRPIAEWSEGIYKSFFKDLPFQLLENDYVLGPKKIGGNAQYIQKNRWLHHTSFLWDYDHKLMEKILLMPEKRPNYRENRTHSDFLTKLSTHFSNKDSFYQKLKMHLKDTLMAEEISAAPLSSITERPHRKSTLYQISY